MATDASDEHAPAQPDPPPDPWARDGDPWERRRAERQAQTNSQGSTETWDLAEAGTQATASNGAAAQAGAPSDAERAYTHNNGWWGRDQRADYDQARGQPPAERPWDNYQGIPQNRWDNSSNQGWTSWQPPREHREEQDCIDKDRDPCPKWDGNRPETSLKPWLREIKR